MATWFCYDCQENIGDNEYCPYCGLHRSGEEPMSENEAKAVLAKIFVSRNKKARKPFFSEEQRLIYGIHPDDEMYRKVMELDILSKNYRR